MSADDRRVESRVTMVGAGLGTTPERIDDLQARQAQMERAVRPPPSRPFAEVFAASLEAAKLANEDEADDTMPRHPSKGRANMTAYQRGLLGLDEENDEDKILIKG